MNFLYPLLDIGSFIVPFLFSFHPKIRFDKEWRFVFPAIFLMGLIFIPWDIAFTNNGVWGFNEKYLVGIDFLNLPIEEWLFFICIPYACLFTHFCLEKIFFNEGSNQTIVKYLSYGIILFCLIIAFRNVDKDYTFFNFLLCALILGITYYVKPNILPTFYLSFLIILIPFFVVNGVLTGSFIDEQVVWYNNQENLGFRLFTIPFEDVFYALSMLLIPQFMIELFRDRISL